MRNTLRPNNALQRLQSVNGAASFQQHRQLMLSKLEIIIDGLPKFPTSRLQTRGRFMLHIQESFH